MKKINLLLMATAFALFIAGCKSGGNLDEHTAADVIAAHLKSNPEYESVKITLGEVTFSSKNDKEDLKKYKVLEEKNLVELTLEKEKKKFLSKDSVFKYTITLTEQARPYVIKQSSNSATVKATDYVLADEKPITLINGDSKIARVTVSLEKQKNEFAIFLKNKETASNFITKTYKLRFKKEKGWVLVGD